jgi:hypothetical protein
MKGCELVVWGSQHCGKEATVKVVWRKTTNTASGRAWQKPVETYLCSAHVHQFRNGLDHCGYFEVEEEQLRERVRFT